MVKKKLLYNIQYICIFRGKTLAYRHFILMILIGSSYDIIKSYFFYHAGYPPNTLDNTSTVQYQVEEEIRKVFDVETIHFAFFVYAVSYPTKLGLTSTLESSLQAN